MHLLTFFQSMRLMWRLIHRGTTFELTTAQGEGVRIHLGCPPNVRPELLARCLATAFRAGIASAAIFTDVRVEMESFTNEAASYSASWQTKT
jgi:hypothetical protein